MAAVSDFTVLIAQAKQNKEKQDKVAERVRAEKEKRERERRRKMEDEEKRQREMEAKLRQRHFEQQKRDEEAKRKKEAQDKAAEAARLKREAEARHALIHGAAKKTNWPSSGTKRARDSADDADDVAPGGNFLTREEKREKQRQAMFRTTSSKRGAPKGYSKMGGGRALPGGAVNVPASSSSSGSGSIKERLMQAPNGLIKLNTVKRDMRTIDEIVSDLHTKRTLNGDQAKTFDNWFGDNKKKPPTATPTPKKSSSVAPPSRPSSSASSSKASSSKSKATKPPPRKRLRSESPPPAAPAIRSLIWEAMGYDGSKRPSNADVFSDDEDMEADAFDVDDEEERSARVARREDAIAMAEEKRHEEEKRRRKMGRKADY